eukprot:GHRQ01030489.1.p1 GENE.GHRQ01030489.1~~GHRQ01030489.1.p1  ORF type:complete len:115 (+),score=42.69 GHRQ01030489.1:980-1324(+)
MSMPELQVCCVNALGRAVLQPAAAAVSSSSDGSTVAAPLVCEHNIIGSKCGLSPDSCRTRAEARAKAAAHLAAGNVPAAVECYQRCVDITPAMAKQVIEVSSPQLGSSRCVVCH